MVSGVFDLEEYYKNARSGEVCHDTSIISYIKSFERVVLWGGEFSRKGNREKTDWI